VSQALQNQIKFQGKIPSAAANANQLINHGVTNNKANGKLSFANEFIKVQQEEKEFNQQNFDQASINNNDKFEATKTIKPTTAQHLSVLNNLSEQFHKTSLKEAQTKLKEIRDEEDKLETFHSIHNEESHAEAVEITDKFSTHENTKAQAMQDHQKTVTEAVMEGNVAPKEQNHQDGNDRKKQLSNWEELAPRIIEDSKNRAVRIDIPGLNDLETIIVRMRGGNVLIQATGSKEVMQRLQANESELSRKLRTHNISLESLQAFDSASLKRRTA